MSATERGQLLCPNCGNFIDECNCHCPYCAEIEKDDCAIGYGRATGGG